MSIRTKTKGMPRFSPTMPDMVEVRVSVQKVACPLAGETQVKVHSQENDRGV